MSYSISCLFSEVGVEEWAWCVGDAAIRRFGVRCWGLGRGLGVREMEADLGGVDGRRVDGYGLEGTAFAAVWRSTCRQGRYAASVLLFRFDSILKGDPIYPEGGKGYLSKKRKWEAAFS